MNRDKSRRVRESRDGGPNGTAEPRVFAHASNGRKQKVYAMTCPECGAAVPAVPVGRPRRFCSSACTRAWHNVNKRLTRDLESVLVEAAEAHTRARAAETGPEWMQSSARASRQRALTLEAEAQRIETELTARRAS